MREDLDASDVEQPSAVADDSLRAEREWGSARMRGILVGSLLSIAAFWLPLLTWFVFAAH